MQARKPRILFYDIETSYLMFRGWSCGEQVVRHDNLVAPYDRYNIICLSYCWNDKKKPKCIGWGLEEQDSESIIREFDEIAQEADVLIGKNSDRFDVKHINTLRWMHGLPPAPEWCLVSDDLEKQVRRHFYLPSYSLDYLSTIRGQGGKTKMEFDDWIQVVENKSLKHYNKMMSYCNKDVEDTRKLWFVVEPYIKPKFSTGRFIANQLGLDLYCKYCGSTNLSKNGIDYRLPHNIQRFKCNDCLRPAARCPILTNGKLGKVR